MYILHPFCTHYGAGKMGLLGTELEVHNVLKLQSQCEEFAAVQLQ